MTNTDDRKFQWRTMVDGEKAVYIDFATGKITAYPGFEIRAGTENGTVLGDRTAYRDVWCSVVKSDDPSEILMVLRLYKPEGQEEYGVTINDKYMAQNTPSVRAPNPVPEN